MHKNYLAIGALLGGTGVALGAFGAHGLQKLTADEQVLHGYQTAVQYQLYHSLALISVSLLSEKIKSRWINTAMFCFITGIIFFSGSLYLLTWLKLQNSDATRYVGPITPVGGLFLIAGWLFLVGAALKRDRS